MLPTSTDVLIVGAGPTGLALAIALQTAGVDHLLIDKLPHGQGTSRAAVVHAHTLEMLEGLGISETLIERGLSLARFAIRDRDRALLQLRFDALPSTYRCLLMIPQDVTERILTERLIALGGTIHRGVAASVINQDETGARAVLTTGEGECAVSARYVVGADGMHSIVRAAAGTAFKGSDYKETFVLTDVEMRWSLGHNEVSLFFSPAGLVVVAPLPGGLFRIVATLEDAPERPSIPDIQRLIDTRGPRETDNRIDTVVWSSRFRLQHRVVDSYRSGCLFLMGDAAHVHSPAGGQGMNTGLVDAVVLGRLLVNVLRDGQSDGALDSYSSMRRAAAVEVLGLAGRLTRMATTSCTPRRAIRNAVLRMIDRLAPAKTRLVNDLSGLSRKRFAEVA